MLIVLRHSGFNTSHVTLYLLRNQDFNSLYLVSIHLMLLFILAKSKQKSKWLSFNTSHVTLYPGSGQPIIFIHLFQYISCYSLSCSFLKYFPYSVSFQYISCYSLSRRKTRIRQPDTLFQYISCYSLSGCRRQDFYPFFNVSIHLMLLFI